jgi:hypothetical protein
MGASINGLPILAIVPTRDMGSDPMCFPCALHVLGQPAAFAIAAASSEIFADVPEAAHHRDVRQQGAL